jgi:hypothetical protein
MTKATKNPDIRYYLALAIIKKLWVDGLITAEEMKRIDERNRASFAA